MGKVLVGSRPEPAGAGIIAVPIVDPNWADAFGPEAVDTIIGIRDQVFQRMLCVAVYQGMRLAAQLEAIVRGVMPRADADGRAGGPPCERG